MEAIKAASKHPSSRFVVVIEEINRGNPAQIFGELLTLLEAGKRTPSEALELCYPDADGTRRPVHIPENLYVIGTMNITDRSLALVDLALRRRFAFISLHPRLGHQLSAMKKHTEARLEDAIIDHLTIQGGYAFVDSSMRMNVKESQLLVRIETWKCLQPDLPDQEIP